MKNKRRIQGLYAIADRQWNPFPTMAELVGHFLRGGCRMVQLRMKGEEPHSGTFLEEARAIALFKKQFDFTFIVNDHAEIAAEVRADGVHVGEHDQRISDIRKNYGPNLIIGYSSHSMEEAVSAQATGADYAAFGAIFPTKTKGPGHPVQGLSRLREVVSRLTIPVVAIGGVTRTNIASVIETGAASCAVISALAVAKDIEGETRWFVHATTKNV